MKRQKSQMTRLNCVKCGKIFWSLNYYLERCAVCEREHVSQRPYPHQFPGVK